MPDASNDVIDRVAPPPGLTAFFQTGYVVPDLGNALDFFTEQLGARPFLVIKDAQLTDQRLRGRPFEPRQDLAFGYIGNLQLEVICPTGGDDSAYTEFLAAKPAGGLHHVATVVDDMDSAIEEVGADVVQSGRFGPGTVFTYLDVTAPTGSMLELIHLDKDGSEMFDRLRRGELP